MRFHVSYFVDSRPIGQIAKPIASPLCHAYVDLGLKDLLNGLRRGGLRVSVVTSGDAEAGEAISDLVAAAAPASDQSFLAACRRVKDLELALAAARDRVNQLLDTVKN